VTPDSVHDLSVMPHRQTLAESAAQVLLAQLNSGRWTEFLPGERELCEEFQISRPTLRQALKVLEREGRVKVAQGRRRRIIARPGRRIPAARQKVIGLLSPFSLKALPPFVLFWIDEVRSNLAKVGYRLEFHVSGRTGAASHPDRALEQVVFTAPASLWILLLSTPAGQQWFRDRNLPCLVAGSCAPEVRLPSIDIDYRAACHHAVGVFRRGGHQHLALIIPASGTGGDADSEAGFLGGAAEGPPPVILRHDGTRAGILRSLEGALRLNTPPTGFLVARSAHVLTVLTLLMQRGRRLPREAAVISRDDDYFLDFVTPQVARYGSDPARFARQLFQMILQMVRFGPTTGHPIRLMPTFIPGETV
jgi:DNA-binding LacI/PurR family transcriptional regulator